MEEIRVLEEIIKCINGRYYQSDDSSMTQLIALNRYTARCIEQEKSSCINQIAHFEKEIDRLRKRIEFCDVLAVISPQLIQN